MTDHIDICGVRFAVKMCEDNFSADCHMGEITYAEGEIRINKDMPEMMQTTALIHEWIHGAMVMLGYNDLSADEKLVSALAMAINQTFEIRKSQGLPKRIDTSETRLA